MVITLLAMIGICWRWGNQRLTGTNPVPQWVFVAILFTSGLDVGLIMFPLSEFPVYADIIHNPSYAFSNPLAIEFGFWGFLIWSIYFLTCFYFAYLEPNLGFFKLRWVKGIHNLVIISTCAFTAYLLFLNLPWYAPEITEMPWAQWLFALIVFTSIVAAVCSSTQLRFVAILSVGSGALFVLLLCGMLLHAMLTGEAALKDYVQSLNLLSDYFPNIYKFVLPLNDYHAFYLSWWFAWSIMIGQFTARFLNNIQTKLLVFHMLCWPSLAIALWFSVLYVYYSNTIATTGLINLLMVFVGIVFVVNSLDSLIRLYTDNLNLTVKRLSLGRYIVLNITVLSGLTILFSIDFLKIQWVGALVIGLFICSALFAIQRHGQQKSTTS